MGDTMQKFTIGTSSTALGMGGKQGRAQDTRQRMEDKTRKERRDSLMEEIRKPLVSTPKRKRERREEESSAMHTKDPEEELPVRNRILPGTSKCRTEKENIGVWIIIQ